MSFEALTAVEEALHKAVCHAFPESNAAIRRLRASNRVCIAYDGGKTRRIPNSRASPTANTETIAILLASFDEVMRWHHGDRREWRASLEHDERKMKYSQIRPGLEQLTPLTNFLRTASSMEGLLLTLTIPNTPRFVFTNREDSRVHPDLTDYRHWKPKVFEQLVRFATFLGIGLSLITHPDQEVLWLSDNDDLIANENFRAQASRFVGCRISASLGHAVTPHLAPLELLTNRLAAEDVLSIPDVAAGGMGEYLERCATEFGSTANIWLPCPAAIQSKASEVACWFGLSDGKLLKRAFAYDAVRGMAVRYLIAVQERRHLDA